MGVPERMRILCLELFTNSILLLAAMRPLSNRKSHVFLAKILLVHGDFHIFFTLFLSLVHHF